MSYTAHHGNKKAEEKLYPKYTIVFATGSPCHLDTSIAEYYRAFAGKFSQKGHRVILLYNGDEEVSERDCPCPKGVECFQWPSPRPTKIADALFLIRLIRRYRPQYLFANFASVNWMLLLGRIMRVPHRIAWFHTLTEQLEIDEKNALSNRIKRIRKRWVYRGASLLIPVSKYAQKDLIDTYGVDPRKTKVLYNLLSSGIGKLRFKKRRHQIICVGRLDRSKGQDILIKAMSYVVSKLPEARVLLVGEGPERASLEKLAESQGLKRTCRFLGRKSMKEVLALMGKSELCIVPSRMDNLPTVALEAQAVGTPVVVSDVGGIPETIEEGISGISVPPEDPAALSEAVVDLLSDDVKLHRMSVAARECFLRRFSDTLLSEYVAFFEKYKHQTRHYAT